MLSQVKRKQELLFTLTLTVLITGSILAFSIQAAYSAADYNSSRSNTSTAIAEIEKLLDELKAYAKISGDANMISSIDNMEMELKKAKEGLFKMNEFVSAMNVELQSLKQIAEVTEAEPIAESTIDTGKTIDAVPAGKDGISVAGFGAIGVSEQIVGIEELSTLNVGDVKNAGIRMGPIALGTPLLEISSDSVCGDTLCDTPMSVQEKIQMYLQSRGLILPER